MNRILNKLERKIGRYAIPNLILWLLAGYAIGFVLLRMMPDVFYFVCRDYDAFLLSAGTVSGTYVGHISV